MSDVFDRLLEHVLREELGAERAEPDLAARVAAAVSAAALRTTCARMKRLRRVRLALTATAAATVVAMAWLAARPAGLECSAPLLTAAAPDEPFAMRARLADGAFAWCAGDTPVSVAAADGTTLVIAPRTACVVGTDRREVELLGGMLELQPRRAPWRATIEHAELVVPAGASVRCVLFLDLPDPPNPTDPNMNPNDLRELLRATTVAAIFTVTVLEGTADLATAQRWERLTTGQTRTVDTASDRAASDHAAADRARELYQMVRNELSPPVDEAGKLAAKELGERFRELTIMVAQRGPAAAAIRPDVVRDLAGDKLAAAPRSRALQLALLDDEERAFSVASRVWAEVQDADLDVQVALAERGFEPAMAALRETLTKSRGAVAARVAAALAFGGDASARARLQPFLALEFGATRRDSWVLEARCQAAIALAELGDTSAVVNLRSAIATHVDALLAEGDAQKLALADWCVKRATYYLAGDRPRVSWSDLRVRAATGRPRQPDEATVRAGLQAIAPK